MVQLRRVAAALAVVGLAVVAIADLASKGASATALAWLPIQQQPLLVAAPPAGGPVSQARPMIVNIPQGALMRQQQVAQARPQMRQVARPQPVRLINIPGAGRGSMFLTNDGALDDLYNEHGIETYVWAGAHADGYDPETQNAWADLPMDRDAIKEAEGMGFAGTAEKSMSHPTPYEAPFNAWDYLPEKEEKSLSTHVEAPPPENVWSDMTLEY
uniref:Uncharacterized protein n=1 Tax=Hemiselmis andersenii TaxID=464988 RepID=A0A6T8K1X5_HEMAN|mmetsp:Transcript_2264/g.5044  ORF Transcript_2264/g.5044 Transcript_2264/m.5044 type:complete len:214 (+) Transcript_2264:28-669(+)